MVLIPGRERQRQRDRGAHRENFQNKNVKSPFECKEVRMGADGDILQEDSRILGVKRGQMVAR